LMLHRAFCRGIVQPFSSVKPNDLAMRSSFELIVAEIRAGIAARGWCYLPSAFRDAGVDDFLELARELGHIYIPPGASPTRPLIETRPSAGADDFTPFDQPGAIGWHNDFSTHLQRPVMSLAWLARADPLDLGAWQIASCDEVFASLEITPGGAETLRFLSETELPYSFTRDAPKPAFFRAIERRGPGSGRFGLRFYGRAMRDGARQFYGTIPGIVEHVISEIEAAADRVGHTLHAPSGSLLVADNWHALHNRLTQTVDVALPLRYSCLCFIEALHEPLPQHSSPATLT
jgi:hypothetical protein